MPSTLQPISVVLFGLLGFYVQSNCRPGHLSKHTLFQARGGKPAAEASGISQHSASTGGAVFVGATAAAKQQVKHFAHVCLTLSEQ